MSKINLENITDEQILKIRISLDTYLYLQKHLDVFDDHFKLIYYNFYLKSQPLMRVQKNKDIYFQIMEESKDTKQIEEIITKLHDSFGLIEFSFATKILHTYHNELPIYDRKVCEYLNSIENGVNKKILSRNIDKSTDTSKYFSKLNNIKEYWLKLINWYQVFIESHEGKTWIQWFNFNFPDAESISNIKKIDFIIFGCIN